MKINLFSNVHSLSSSITGSIKLFTYTNNYCTFSIGEGLNNHHIGSVSVQAPTASCLLVSYSYSLDETETGRPFHVLLCCTFSKNIIHSNACALSSAFLVTTLHLDLNICCSLGEWMRCRKGTSFFLYQISFRQILPSIATFLFCWHITRDRNKYCMSSILWVMFPILILDLNKFSYESTWVF